MPIGRPHVAVIGAGMSGLYMAKCLADRGMTYTIFEKADEVGGTWRDNTYPGLYCDVPVSMYHLRISPKYDWSHAYAPGPEIQRYLQRVADEHELRQNTEFGTELVDARWTGAEWELAAADGRVFSADAVVAATGFLHRPTLPVVPGVESFTGVQFHSSCWPRGLDLAGKRVGVVGTGSSGIQIVSRLAYEDCEVVQFVRTPQWIETVDNPALSDEVRTRMAAEPERARELLLGMESGINQDPRLRDPRWKLEPGRMRDEAMQALREDLLVIEDPALRELLTPDYPPGCKRIPKSPWYYRAVQEPSVTVVAGGVERIEPTGVVATDGNSYELDVIVFATGFNAHAYMRPMQVQGLNGVLLDDVWADGPFAYRGVGVPAFPNFFLLHGPFSPVNNVPVPKTLDDEIGYVARVLDLIAEKGVAVWPTDEATERFRDWIDAHVPRTVWASGCDNWYKGNGRTPLIWPWYDREHEDMFAELALDDLDVIDLHQLPSAPSPASA